MRAGQAQAMAEYNRWMNQRLYGLCAALSDVERKQDRGAFFKSIHGTLNHLLLGDRIWLGRFKNEPLDVEGLDQELHADFEALADGRRATDDDIIAWAATLTDSSLGGPFEFTSFINPRRRRCPLWAAVAHFFNHQTHHRGQLTTLLSQLGRDPGVTDFLWLPGLVDEA